MTLASLSSSLLTCFLRRSSDSALLANTQSWAAVLQEDLSTALDNLHLAWQALRRLRFEVEMRAGDMTAPEPTGPIFAEECERIARGVITIYERALAVEAKLADRRT
jgi:hypothetical protein